MCILNFGVNALTLFRPIDKIVNGNNELPFLSPWIGKVLDKNKHTVVFFIVCPVYLPQNGYNPQNVSVFERLGVKIRMSNTRKLL